MAKKRKAARRGSPSRRPVSPSDRRTGGAAEEARAPREEAAGRKPARARSGETRAAAKRAPARLKTRPVQNSERIPLRRVTVVQAASNVLGSVCVSRWTNRRMVEPRRACIFRWTTWNYLRRLIEAGDPSGCSACPAAVGSLRCNSARRRARDSLSGIGRDTHTRPRLAVGFTCLARRSVIARRSRLGPGCSALRHCAAVAWRQRRHDRPVQRNPRAVLLALCRRAGRSATPENSLPIRRHSPPGGPTRARRRTGARTAGGPDSPASRERTDPSCRPPTRA